MGHAICIKQIFFRGYFISAWKAIIARPKVIIKIVSLLNSNTICILPTNILFISLQYKQFYEHDATINNTYRFN